MKFKFDGWTCIILAIILVLIFVFMMGKKNEGYDSYYANWNYSPYYTPLPVGESSYDRFYTDLPALIDRWLVR